MKKSFITKSMLSIIVIAAIAIVLTSCGKKYKYETVKGDPM